MAVFGLGNKFLTGGTQKELHPSLIPLLMEARVKVAELTRFS